MSSRFIAGIDSVVLAGAVVMAGWLVTGWPFVFRKRTAGLAMQKTSGRFYLKISLAAAGCGLIVSWLNPDNIYNLLIYFMALFFLPYVYMADVKRKKDERVFADVIIYVSEMALMLKQDGNVYTALSRTNEELDNPLHDDISRLIATLAQSRTDTVSLLSQMAIKYPYTIIRQLNILILQMYYESNISDNGLLASFQNDIDRLSYDVRTNQSRRKVLRIQYIGLTAGCVVSLWLMAGQLNTSLSTPSTKTLFSSVTLGFDIAVLAILFIVDQYFNTHTTRE